LSEPLVIVGNGMAAARLVDELVKTSLGRYAIAVIGEEPRLAYNRVLLSSVLAGEVASSDLELKPPGWWRDRGITLRYGCRASAIDTAARNSGRPVTTEPSSRTASQPRRASAPSIEQTKTRRPGSASVASTPETSEPDSAAASACSAARPSASCRDMSPQ